MSSDPRRDTTGVRPQREPARSCSGRPLPSSERERRVSRSRPPHRAFHRAVLTGHLPARERRGGRSARQVPVSVPLAGSRCCALAAPRCMKQQSRRWTAHYRLRVWREATTPTSTPMTKAKPTSAPSTSEATTASTTLRLLGPQAGCEARRAVWPLRACGPQGYIPPGAFKPQPVASRALVGRRRVRSARRCGCTRRSRTPASSSAASPRHHGQVTRRGLTRPRSRPATPQGTGYSLRGRDESGRSTSARSRLARAGRSGRGCRRLACRAGGRRGP
jgi:hypothetical protein